MAECSKVIIPGRWVIGSKLSLLHAMCLLQGLISLVSDMFHFSPLLYVFLKMVEKAHCGLENWADD